MFIFFGDPPPTKTGFNFSAFYFLINLPNFINYLFMDAENVGFFPSFGLTLASGMEQNNSNERLFPIVFSLDGVFGSFSITFF